MIFKLKDYQEKKTNELFDKCIELLGMSAAKSIVFESPTGSGKTIMLAHLINLLVNKLKNKDDVCFIWLCPRPLLTNQSKEKLEEYLSDATELDFSHFDNLTDNLIRQHEILFMNWESINKKNNTIVTKNEKGNFLSNVIENTIQQGRKIVLIIDESHFAAGSEKSRELISDFNANLTIQVSATPSHDSPDEKVKVYLEQVKSEGMIKKSAILNQGYVTKLDQDNLISEANQSSDEGILIDALKKRSEIQRIFLDKKKDINPLLLIQLPDARSNQDKMQVDKIIKILEKNSISVANGKLAIHLSGDDNKENLYDVKKENSNVEVLIFKHALALGWDCPRAHVLALFRDWKSLSFSIQTLGRIMRMPEPRIGHYDDEILNHAYVYTNISGIELKEDMSKSYVSIHTSKRTKDTNLSILSVFKKRNRHKTRFNNKFIKIFLNQAKKYDLKDKLKITNNKISYNLISETEIKDHDLKDSIEASLETRIENRDDLQRLFDYFLKDSFDDFYPEPESVNYFKHSIYKFFEENLSLDYENDYERILNISLDDRNKKHIKNVFDFSSAAYRDKVLPLIEDQINSNEEWDIPNILNYSYDVTEIPSQKSILKPLFVSNLTIPEKKFIEYLDNSDEIEWWYRNGDSDNTHFAVEYEESNMKKPFYVDFIIKLKNGRIGYMDTKSGWTVKDAVSSGKVKGLNQFLNKDSSFFGGIVINTNQTDCSGSWRVSKNKIINLEMDNKDHWEALCF